MKRTIKILDVMYYYTQIQYNLLLKNVSPSIQPSIILGTFISFPISLLIDSAYIYFFCSLPSPWIFISVCFVVIIIMLGIYEVYNRKERVIKRKPIFFNNKKLTLIITITIELISLASLFLGGPVGKYLLKHCGWSG